MSNFDKKADSSAGKIPGPPPNSGAAPKPRVPRASGVLDKGKKLPPPRRSSIPGMPKAPPRPAPSEDAEDLAITANREEEAEKTSDDKKAKLKQSGQQLRGKPASDDVPVDLDWDDDEAEDAAEAKADAAGEDAVSDEDSKEEYKESADPNIGSTISDRYVIDAHIGEGGMGRVYLAHHKVIGKQVAIKILHSELARDKEAVGRFVREAKSASSIGNAHIVDISDFGETDDGSTYFVMEYLDGDALADLMENKKALPTDMVCDIALQMADGLAAAHRKDIIHRDLKPDNVHLVTQGKQENFVKILDFGIAKVSTSTSSTKLTMAGAVFGTPHYMSPEQAAGAAVDTRTDIYSLGVMMYEMVSGKLPFNADNFMGILTQHMYKAPVPIRALVGAPECTPGLEALILKCLSKKPDARYQTMEELAEDIRKYQADGVPVAVHEMMARSGNFNVPADYFKASDRTMPATPHGKRERLGPRYVLFAGIAVAVLVVLFVLMRDSTTTAQTPAGTDTTPAPTEPAETTADTTPTEPSAAPAGKTNVLLYSVPAGAVGVFEGKEYQLPDTFAVPDGKKLTVVVKLAGHADKQVELDGSQQRFGVSLTPQARPGQRRMPIRRKQTPKPSGGKSGRDVVDPWGN